jgi:hypothetical protein
MSTIEEIRISESIINQINEINDSWTIRAFNNDHTPFQLVFMVLVKVVPMPEDKAYETTFKIHTDGEADLYTGSKEHCEKIGKALDVIKVKFDIF